MQKDYMLQMKPAARKEAVVTGGKYRFTILTDRLVRMEYQEEGRFVDEPTQKVICRDFPVPEYRVMETEDCLEIVTKELHLYYDKKPFSGERLSIQLQKDFHVYGSVWNYGDEINDLRGTARTLDNVDGATVLDGGLMSKEGFTVMDDSITALIAEDQWIEAKTVESTDLYFFGYGHDYLGCLRDFYRLSGAVPLLPRFTLGNWWSRFYRYTEENYIKLMNRFREKEIPFAVSVLDMDWHLTDIPAKYGSGWSGYTWNTECFPDPERFLKKLHDMGMRVTLNVHPADGVRGHEEAYLAMAKELGIDYENEDKIPFDITNRQFMDAYFKYLHHPNEERGVDFWWLDWQQGSRSKIAGLDPLWMLNHLHYLDSGRDGKRPLTFSRYAGIGSHRYPIGFSGDSFSTWESLDFQPYFTANASNVGYSWWSHDIGGHQGGKRDDELAVRWIQFGVFSPIMRLHSTSNEFYGKEPWNYNGEAERIMTAFLRLRHRMIPYLYSMNYLTHLKGLPLLQPMYYHHEEKEAYSVPNQYYFGTQMIVCPITSPVNDTLLAGVDAWLPEGEYFDFFTGQHYKGGRRLKLYRGLESIPVLVRAGGIVPMAKDYRDCHIHNPRELEVHVFNGADGSFELYEDSEEEMAKKEPVITHFEFTQGSTAKLRIQIEGEPEGVIPEDRCYDIHMKGFGEPLQIVFEDSSIEFTQYYDEEMKEIRICFHGGHCREMHIQIQLKEDKIVSFGNNQVIYRLLQRAQIAYSVKENIFWAVCREISTERLVSELMQMDLEENLRGAIMEQILMDC